MRARWLLLPVLAAGVTLTQDRYILQASITFTDPIVRSVPSSSVQQCARFCSSMSSAFCDGFRYGAGACQLLSSPHHCLLSVQRSAGDPASYRRQPLTGSVPLCAPGWIPFDGSCYLRDTAPQTRSDAETLCATENPCSRPIYISTRVEVAFVFYHWSRPPVSEWTGAILIDGRWRNLDGTHIPSGLTISGTSGCCLATQANRFSNTLLSLNSPEQLPAICEAVQPSPGPVSGCPPGWLQLDSACFTYRPEQLAHQEADQFCGSLMGSARLGHPVKPGDQRILTEFVRQSGNPSPIFWVGVHDNDIEGDWRSMDGSPCYFEWNEKRPAGMLNDLENCLLLFPSGEAYDDQCSKQYPFICQIKPAQLATNDTSG